MQSMSYRLSDHTMNETIFNKAKEDNKPTLKNNGYSDKTKKIKIEAETLWFNPPYNEEKKNKYCKNIHEIDKHFSTSNLLKYSIEIY